MPLFPNWCENVGCECANPGPEGPQGPPGMPSWSSLQVVEAETTVYPNGNIQSFEVNALPSTRVIAGGYRFHRPSPNHLSVVPFDLTVYTAAHTGGASSYEVRFLSPTEVLVCKAFALVVPS